MLKSKPRDDRFPDHIISQTGIHTPKSGVLFRQVLASGLPQSDRISNHSYELLVHIEVFIKTNSFSPSILTNTLGKEQTNLQNDSNGQVQKRYSNFPPLKEMSSSHNWPKLGKASNHFNQCLEITMLC